MSLVCRSGRSQARTRLEATSAHSLGSCRESWSSPTTSRYFHTTGDTPENVAWSGLEAATRAYAKIIDEVNKLPLSDLQRPPVPRTPRIDFASCAAWVKDSSAACTQNTEQACAITSPGC